jgi:protein-cysteine N-palmitoyltransferase HHAT
MGSTLDEKQRYRTAHPLEVYNFSNYIAYVLYPPLYIAGPIMSFNDFMWQVLSLPVVSASVMTPLTPLR